MTVIGIIAGGPKQFVPPLKLYHEINYWIGVDAGNKTLLENEIKADLAIGDFDSISYEMQQLIRKNSHRFEYFSSDKNETDLELAIHEALKLSPKKVYIFQATGGRLDHEWMNIYLLKQFAELNIDAWIVDNQNMLTIKQPGYYELERDDRFSYISFLPISNEVIGLTLKGFRYELTDCNIKLGSSLTVSNEWNEKKGTYLFKDGILFIIKSRD